MKSRVYWGVAVNPDCTSMGQTVIRLTQAPQHGRITIRNASMFPNFPESNPRNICNRRRIPGAEAVYRPDRGYAGPDSAGFELIAPNGAYRSGSVNIMVR
jgi:hypothetical protein